jgi:hypothetical protein
MILSNNHIYQEIPLFQKPEISLDIRSEKISKISKSVGNNIFSLNISNTATAVPL